MEKKLKAARLDLSDALRGDRLSNRGPAEIDILNQRLGANAIMALSLSPPKRDQKRPWKPLCSFFHRDLLSKFFVTVEEDKRIEKCGKPF